MMSPDGLTQRFKADPGTQGPAKASNCVIHLRAYTHTHTHTFPPQEQDSLLNGMHTLPLLRRPAGI